MKKTAEQILESKGCIIAYDSSGSVSEYRTYSKPDVLSCINEAIDLYSPKWNPCSERLPEDDDKVDIIFNGRRFIDATFQQGRFCFLGYSFSTLEVDFWMPIIEIPQPPTE